MRWKPITVTTLIAIYSMAILFSVMPMSVHAANEETAPNYWVTVNPTTISSPFYTSVNRNWTVSFEAKWSYGANSGQLIKNATAIIQVTSLMSNVTNMLSENTTTGIFSFNYTSSTAEIFTFTPVILVSPSGIVYNSTLVQNGGSNEYGLQSTPVTIWWDTFHISLLSSTTNTLGATAVSVNVTYLLVPEEGLTLKEAATHLNQTFIPKIVSGANVTINGVKAEETTVPGIYTTDISTWFPTAYIIVGVSQEGRILAQKAFSYSHTSNSAIWLPATIVSLAILAALWVLHYALTKKSKGTVFFGKTRYPMLGGILLAVASVISFYWGIVGIDSTLHGFDWALLAAAGLISFGLGLAGATMAIMKKGQAGVILAVCLPLIINLVVVKTSLESYQLIIPWPTVLFALAASIVSGILISNSNGQFRQSANFESQTARSK